MSKFFFIIRYVDDIFMTTTQTIEEINVELHKAQNKDMNTKIQSTINTSVHFLGAWTIRRRQFDAWAICRTDNSSHGQSVACTIRCIDDSSRG